MVSAVAAAKRRRDEEEAEAEIWSWSWTFLLAFQETNLKFKQNFRTRGLWSGCTTGSQYHSDSRFMHIWFVRVQDSQASIDMYERIMVTLYTVECPLFSALLKSNQ
jgi:hypothetical protein